MSEQIFLECSCYSEGIKFDYSKEENTLEISIYQRGLTPRTRSWKEKLRWIWQIITKDNVYGDEIILEKNNIDKLTQFVNENIANNTIFINEKTPNKILKKGTLYKLQNEDFAFRYLGERYNIIDNKIYHRFKHHQLKEIFITDESLIEREADSEEVRIYDLLKQEANRFAK